jgi:predicted  nucleic acid-binding Zn-ribbon protein
MFGEISGNPLKSKEKIVGVVALIRDITERKKTEEELKEKNEELEKFNKFAVGRELRIIELKNKVKELEKKLEKIE